jgi:hypothetical protein
LQQEIVKLRRTESRAVPGRTLREGVTGRATARPEDMEMAEIRAEEDIPAARKEKPVRQMKKQIQIQIVIRALAAEALPDIAHIEYMSEQPIEQPRMPTESNRESISAIDLNTCLKRMRKRIE